MPRTRTPPEPAKPKPRAVAKPRKREPGIISATPPSFDPADFRRHLALWYRRNARKLPWRDADDPYATWLSEIMLQQTRVATVIDRYTEFLTRFPTISALAAADEADVLALWSGLGYYRRARMLHRGAQFVERELGGKLPRTSEALRTLPGVGDYTSAAIASIAFGEGIAVVDGNVERVLLRILGLPEDRTSAARTHIAQVAQSLVPPKAKRRDRANPPGDHNQAMMELGATICTPRSPLCLHCPVIEFCKTRGEHTTAVRPQQQSRIVAHLLSIRKRSTLTEVLLERRPADASLMPNMLELPPLSLDSVRGLEPVLRLRHAITNTNYFVQIFTESAPDGPPLPVNHYESLNAEDQALDMHLIEDDVFVADPAVSEHPTSTFDLLASIPASPQMLEWTSTTRLTQLPLTGLARKALQRLGVMPMPKIRLA